jgi:hypothetical protein
MRDLQKDLETCNKATEGPWETDEHYQGNVYCDDSTGSLIAQCLNKWALRQEPNVENNAQFIAESREGWPEAINRAIAAEARAKEFEDGISKHLIDKNAHGTFDTFDRNLWKILEGK